MQKCRAPSLAQLPADQPQQKMQGPADGQSPTAANTSGLLVEGTRRAGRGGDGLGVTLQSPQ